MTQNRTTEQLSDEQFEALLAGTESDKWIHAISSAVPNYNRWGKYLGKMTATYPVEYIVTGEQIDCAKVLRDNRHEELLQGIAPGELVFVSMGGDYGSDDPDSVGNHRIRCNFLNDAGEDFFLELCKGLQDKKHPEETFWVDFSVDLRKDREYDAETIRVRNHNSKCLNYSEHLPYPVQDQYNARGVARTRIGMPFTWSNVLEWVNTTYGCSYTSARKIDHFVTCDEFINRPVATKND